MKKIFFLLVMIMTLSLLFACKNEEVSTDPAALGDATSGNATSGDTTPGSSASGETAPETTLPHHALVEVSNPVYHTGNDPWVIAHKGHYYYCFSGGGGVKVGEIPSLDQITDQTAKQVYTAPQGTMYSKEYWAPELHYLNGEWYIYVAADDGQNANHRMYVLKGTSQDPTKPFRMVGKISDPSDKWAIDGTVLTYNGEMYFVWSGWEGDTDGRQDLYIAHMSDPTTIDSERVRIATPTAPYEKSGMPLEEGPAALCHNGQAFILFSASGSWTDDYCISYLRLTGDDPMDPGAWKKASRPLVSKKAGLAYGPGHCSVAPAEDGSLWLIMHANPVSGTGWQGRTVWLAPLTFNEAGLPVVPRLSETVLFPKKN